MSAGCEPWPSVERNLSSLTALFCFSCLQHCKPYNTYIFHTCINLQLAFSLIFLPSFLFHPPIWQICGHESVCGILLQGLMPGHVTTSHHPGVTLLSPRQLQHSCRDIRDPPPPFANPFLFSFHHLSPPPVLNLWLFSSYAVISFFFHCRLLCLLKMTRHLNCYICNIFLFRYILFFCLCMFLPLVESSYSSSKFSPPETGLRNIAFITWATIGTGNHVGESNCKKKS